jgi:DNA-binding MarR family transcriptional regulator
MVAEVNADLPTLVVIGARAIVDETMADLRARGIDDVRPLHGFLFAALRGDGLSVGALADRLEVSHQAAGKVVSEMEGLGLVRRVPDSADARRRIVTLTPKAREVMEAGGAARAAIVRRLEDACGPDDLAAATRVMEQVVGWHGGSLDALARRAKPVW